MSFLVKVRYSARWARVKIARRVTVMQLLSEQSGPYINQNSKLDSGKGELHRKHGWVVFPELKIVFSSENFVFALFRVYSVMCQNSVSIVGANVFEYIFTLANLLCGFFYATIGYLTIPLTLLVHLRSLWLICPHVCLESQAGLLFIRKWWLF